MRERSQTPAVLREMRAAGYNVQLDFLWIPELSITRERVKERVAKGGHDIPDHVQQRRFHLGVRNLAMLYRPLLNTWRLFDNTRDMPRPIANEKDGILVINDPGQLALIERCANVRFMPEQPPPTIQESVAYVADAEARAALRAMRKAFADAVLENLRFGLPVIQYRDGKAAKVPAEELAPLARQILAANGEFLPGESIPRGWE